MSLFSQMSGNAEQKGFSTEVEDVAGGNSQLIFSFPKGEDNAIVCKFLLDPRGYSPSREFIPINYFPHLVSNDSRKGARTHPCRQSLKVGDSPEMQHFQELNEKVKEIRNAVYKEYGGESAKKVLEGNDEYQRLVREKKAFQVKRQGWSLLVKPDDPTIYAIKLGTWGKDAIFGKKGYGDNPDVPGVKQRLGNMRQTMFVDQNPEKNRFGWVKLWRTGEGLETTYHAVPLQAEVTDIDETGAPVTQIKPIPKNVHAKIYELESLDDVPDPMEFEKNNLWSLEESQYFVEMKGTLEGTPKRLLADQQGGQERAKNVSDATAEQQAAPQPTPVATTNPDEIPF